MAKGGKVQGLTDAVNTLEREMVKTKTQLEIKVGTLSDEAKRVEALKRAVTDVRATRSLISLANTWTQIAKSIEQKRGSTSNDAAAFAELKTAYDAGVAELAKNEELLQTLLTGLSSSNADDQSAGGYLGQLAEAKARLAAAGTEAEQAKIKIGLAEKEVKEKEPRAKKAEKEGEGSLKELAGKKTEVDTIRKRVQTAAWDDGRERELAEKQAEHSANVAELMEVS